MINFQVNTGIPFLPGQLRKNLLAMEEEHEERSLKYE